jgi:hypothetical protein
MMVFDTDHELTVLVGRGAGAEFRQMAEAGDRVRFLGANAVEEASHAPRLAVFARATHLHEVTHLVSTANKANRLRALLVDSDVEAEWLPYIFERAKLRLLRNLLVHHGASVPMRFVWAWKRNIQSHVVANATAMGDHLVVRNCALKSFEVPFAAYPGLSRIRPQERNEFDIDADGMFLHWPGADVHLTMDDVFEAADPRRKAEAMIRKTLEDKSFGAAVRAFRTERGLLQRDISGISARHLRRIEHGFVPGEDALNELAKAHKMDADAYLEAVTERME